MQTSSNETLATLAKDYVSKLINVETIVQSREENYQLYHSSLEQMAVVQSTLHSVTQQRDELRQLHKVCLAPSCTDVTLITHHTCVNETLHLCANITLMLH